MNNIFLALSLVTLFSQQNLDRFNYDKFYNLDVDLFKKNIFVSEPSSYLIIDYNAKLSESENWYNYFRFDKNSSDYSKILSVTDNLSDSIEYFIEICYSSSPLAEESNYHRYIIIKLRHSYFLMHFSKNNLQTKFIELEELEYFSDEFEDFDFSSRILIDLIYDSSYLFLKIFYNNNYSVKILDIATNQFTNNPKLDDLKLKENKFLEELTNVINEQF